MLLFDLDIFEIKDCTFSVSIQIAKIIIALAGNKKM